MHCIICYTSFYPKFQIRKIYNNTNGIIVLTIDVYVDNSIIAKKLRNMWIFLWRKIGNVAIKEGLIYLAILYSIFLLQKNKKWTFQEKWYVSKKKNGKYGAFN
jgi:hypothetical protein